ncbi:Oidioi.mRNA.OKI2018_I69.chr1.g1720.t1.cds [Oikopleura dioica]|uniref:Oidioi.mRNA.OKI2018_I69.chr1.g1720.t1.cds n=1 Tax=Oikopleura dioica TaxID=34765 RepID=A0ABN7SU18_OIKDI|nr:Oidioi.mRNA.OKI2018_I69.chr1.g1720.t1.cds [Oikopleura dioica]
MENSEDENQGRKQPSVEEAFRTCPLADACMHRPCSCKQFFMLCTSSEEETSCCRVFLRVVLIVFGLVFGIALGAPFGFAFGYVGAVLMILFMPCYIRRWLKDAVLESVDENGQLPKNKFFQNEPYTPNASFNV